MPNYYAHLVFGGEVLSRLEEDLSPFQAGLFGPDPLFFYRPLARNNAPRALGIAMHHSPFRPAAQALRRGVESGLPHAAAYAAGMVCHFALDSACHPLVDRLAGEGLSHGGLEAELDRALMEERGLDPLRRTPLPDLDLPAPFYDTAAAVYPGVSSRQLSQALGSFCRACRLQTRAAGTWAGKLAQALGEKCAPLSFLRGAVLPARPDPAAAPAAEELRTLLLRAAAPTAEHLEAFFSGAPLDDWYDATFHGPAPVPAEALFAS